MAPVLVVLFAALSAVGSDHLARLPFFVDAIAPARSACRAHPRGTVWIAGTRAASPTALEVAEWDLASDHVLREATVAPLPERARIAMARAGDGLAFVTTSESVRYARFFTADASLRVTAARDLGDGNDAQLRVDRGLALVGLAHGVDRLELVALDVATAAVRARADVGVPLLDGFADRPVDVELEGDRAFVLVEQDGRPAILALDTATLLLAGRRAIDASRAAPVHLSLTAGGAPLLSTGAGYVELTRDLRAATPHDVDAASSEAFADPGGDAVITRGGRYAAHAFRFVDLHPHVARGDATANANVTSVVWVSHHPVLLSQGGGASWITWIDPPRPTT